MKKFNFKYGNHLDALQWCANRYVWPRSRQDWYYDSSFNNRIYITILNDEDALIFGILFGHKLL